MVSGRRGNEGKMPSSGRNTVEARCGRSKGCSVYSSASNKLNFVFLNEYFEPLKGGFGAKKHGQPRVRKNDRFFEPMRKRDPGPLF
jgi:hypothetical protein